MIFLFSLKKSLYDFLLGLPSDDELFKFLLISKILLTLQFWIKTLLGRVFLVWCFFLFFFPLFFTSLSISCDSLQFSSVQSLSRVWLFVTPWIAARQASLSITNSWSSLKLTSIESVMPSSHLILCCPLFLLPPNPPSIRDVSHESTIHMRWPKYWSFNFNIIPSKEIPGLIFRMEWLDLLAFQGTLKSLL